MYLAERVLKSWTEDFVDEDTGAVVPITRNEVLFEKGKLIDQDLLSQIMFHIQAGDITSVKVSNQKRMGILGNRKAMYPFAVTIVFADDKKKKLLIQAISFESAFAATVDYCELNCEGFFHISKIQELSDVVILRDNLRTYQVEEVPDVEDFEPTEEIADELKFYELCVSFYTDCGDEVDEKINDGKFIVETTDIEKAFVVIRAYTDKLYKNNNVEPIPYQIKLEAAKPLPLNEIVPIEFSSIYKD
jgi:hypothetical protein